MDETFKPYARCCICTSALLIDEFRILSPCEHSLCINCLKKCFPRGRGNCPLCRVLVRPNVEDSAKMVHVEFIPTKVAQAELVTEGLSRMDKDTKVVSVLRTPAKLRKVVDELEVDDRLANSLLQAISEFKERIVPLYAENKAQKDQLDELFAERDQSENKMKEIEELTAKLHTKEKKVLEMRQAQQRLETERDRVTEMAEKAVEELNAVRGEKTSLGKRVSELETENAMLKGYLQQYKITERRHKAKRKEMQRRLAELEQRAGEDVDGEEATSKTPLTVLQAVVDLDSDCNTLTGNPRTDRREYNDAHSIPLVYPRFDFEGMPGPGFSSNRTSDEHRNVKRIKLSKDKVKEITNFPLSLDRSGHPKVPIQLGPKRKIRVRDPFR